MRYFIFFNFGGLIAQQIFPRSPFHKCQGWWGVSKPVRKKMSFFNVKIVRFSSGGDYKINRRFFGKLFQMMIQAHKTSFCTFLDKSLANALLFQNITLYLVQDDFKCTETAPELLCAILLPLAVITQMQIFAFLALIISGIPNDSHKFQC